MKNIIITGSSGFIGSNLVKFYLKKGYIVYAVAKKDLGIKHIHYNFIYSDLENDDNAHLYKKVNPDIIIHTAGGADVKKSIENPNKDFSNNVCILYKVLQNIDDADIKTKIIFLSSAAVYGNPIRIPVKEDDPLNPISPYGLHKRICEEICMYYIRKGLDINILRIFSAYGENLKKQILWDMYNKLNKYNKLELYGTGEESRDFIHIDDIARAIDIIADNHSNEVIYNVANGYEIKIKTLAEKFINILGLNSNVISFSNCAKSGDPLNWKADITKLRRLGYKPHVQIEDGLSRYVQWLRSIESE